MTLHPRHLVPTLSAILLASPVHADPNTPGTPGTIDGVDPGAHFSYGVHQFQWSADSNANRLIDLDEVEINVNGTWQAVDEDTFTNTIKRRRAGLYMENGFIYKKTPTRDLALYIDFPDNWQESDKRPAIIWFFWWSMEHWNTLRIQVQGRLLCQARRSFRACGLPHPHG